MNQEGNAAFPTTAWSTVLRAKKGSEADFETLCKRYWYPLYAFARRSGKSPEEAEDLTQGFIFKLLQRNWLDQVNPDDCKLRTFLLTRLKSYMRDEWKKQTAQKRGGLNALPKLDYESAERYYTSEMADKLSADRVYLRSWASEMLRRTHHTLRNYYVKKDQAKEFETLYPYIPKDEKLKPYSEVAAELGTSEDWVKTNVSRMRKRYRAVLESEVRETLASASELEEELASLMTAFSS